MSKRRNNRNRGARGSNQRFYAGRTTHTSSETKKLRKQKEYRRQKLSKQKRKEFLEKVRAKGRWVAVGLAGIFVINLMQIKSHSFVGLTGLTEADKRVISELTDSYVSGANRFKTFFDETAYEQHILENASFVSSVTADTSLLSTSLKVRITPKTPVHAYRGSENNDAQWVAQDGTLITLTEDQISDMGSQTPQTVIIDSSGVGYIEGEQITPVSTLEFLAALELEFALEGIEIRAYELSGSPREVRVDITGEKYDLLVSTERAVESLVTDYKIAFAELSSNKQKPSSYIDLRVVDKVFYR